MTNNLLLGLEIISEGAEHIETITRDVDDLHRAASPILQEIEFKLAKTNLMRDLESFMRYVGSGAQAATKSITEISTAAKVAADNVQRLKERLEQLKVQQAFLQKASTSPINEDLIAGLHKTGVVSEGRADELRGWKPKDVAREIDRLHEGIFKEIETATNALVRAAKKHEDILKKEVSGTAELAGNLEKAVLAQERLNILAERYSKLARGPLGASASFGAGGGFGSGAGPGSGRDLTSMGLGGGTGLTEMRGSSPSMYRTTPAEVRRTVSTMTVDNVTRDAVRRSISQQMEQAAYYRTAVEQLDGTANVVDSQYRSLLSTASKGRLKKGETWRSKVLGFADSLEERAIATAKGVHKSSMGGYLPNSFVMGSQIDGDGTLGGFGLGRGFTLGGGSSPGTSLTLARQMGLVHQPQSFYDRYYSVNRSPRAENNGTLLGAPEQYPLLSSGIFASYGPNRDHAIRRLGPGPHIAGLLSYTDPAGPYPSSTVPRLALPPASQFNMYPPGITPPSWAVPRDTGTPEFIALRRASALAGGATATGSTSQAAQPTLAAQSAEALRTAAERVAQETEQQVGGVKGQDPLGNLFRAKKDAAANLRAQAKALQAGTITHAQYQQAAQAATQATQAYVAAQRVAANAAAGGPPPPGAGAGGAGGAGGGGGGGGRAPMTMGQQFARRFQSLALFAPSAVVIYGLVNILREATDEAIKFEQIMANIQGVVPSRSLSDRLIIEDAVIENAKKYGVALGEAANAAQFFAQAGFETPEKINNAMNAALAASRGAGLNPQEAEELILSLHAITKGEIEALEILDRVSRVEARRAVTAKDLFEAITKVGPIAHQLKGDMMGLMDEFDVVMGASAGIIERTRMSGSSAATSMRFMTARLGSPQTLQKLQVLGEEVGGVKLFRNKEGTELRPLIEMLQELSVVYEKLNAKNPAKALQFLVTLGGARQLTATTALMQTFQEEGLNAARMSSEAFGDMAIRTAIALDTVQAHLIRTKDSLVEFGVEGIKVSGGPIKFIADAIGESLQGLSILLKEYDQATNRIGRFFDKHLGSNFYGGSGFEVKALDMDALKDTPQVQDYHKLSQRLGLTGKELFDVVGTAGNGFAGELEKRFNMPLTEIIAKMDQGTLEARGLREEYGLKLVAALSAVDPQLKTLKKNLDDATTGPEKAAAKTALLAEAYELLSKTAFMSSAVLTANDQQIKNQLDAMSNSTDSTFMQARKKPNDWVAQVMDQFGHPPESLFDKKFTDTNDLENLKKQLIGLADDGVQPFMKAMLATAEVQDSWKASIKELIGTGADFGTFTDTVAYKLDHMSKPAWASMISNLKPQIEDALHLSNLDDSNVLIGGGKHQALAKTMAQAYADEAKLIIAERRKSGDSAGDRRLTDLVNVLNGMGSAPAFVDEHTTAGIAKLKDELLKLVLGFYKGEEASKAFAASLQGVGVSYNANQAKFESASGFLKTLLSFRSEQMGRIVELSAQRSRMMSNLLITDRSPNTQETAADDLPDEAKFTARRLMLSQRSKTTMAQIDMQLKQFRGESESLFGNNGINLFNAFGGQASNPELGKVLESFFTTLGLAKANDEKSVEALKVSYDQLINKVEQLTLARAREVDITERQKMANANLQDVTKIKGQYNIAMEGLKGPPEKLAAEFQLEAQLLDIKKKEFDILAAREGMDVITYRRKIDELKNATQRTALEKQMTALAEARSKYEQQINSNMQAATSGLRGALGDPSSFLKERGSSHFGTLLGPAAKVLLDRQIENLFQSALDPADNNGLRRFLHGVFGDNVENKAAQDVADIISQKFIFAGAIVADGLAHAIVTASREAKPTWDTITDVPIWTDSHVNDPRKSRGVRSGIAGHGPNAGGYDPLNDPTAFGPGDWLSRASAYWKSTGFDATSAKMAVIGKNMSHGISKSKNPWHDVGDLFGTNTPGGVSAGIFGAVTGTSILGTMAKDVEMGVLPLATRARIAEALKNTDDPATLAWLKMTLEKLGVKGAHAMDEWDVLFQFKGKATISGKEQKLLAKLGVKQSDLIEAEKNFDRLKAQGARHVAASRIPDKSSYAVSAAFDSHSVFSGIYNDEMYGNLVGRWHSIATANTPLDLFRATGDAEFASAAFKNKSWANKTITRLPGKADFVPPDRVITGNDWEGFLEGKPFSDKGAALAAEHAAAEAAEVAAREATYAPYKARLEASRAAREAREAAHQAQMQEMYTRRLGQAKELAQRNDAHYESINIRARAEGYPVQVPNTYHYEEAASLAQRLGHDPKETVSALEAAKARAAALEVERSTQLAAETVKKHNADVDRLKEVTERHAKDQEFYKHLNVERSGTDWYGEEIKRLREKLGITGKDVDLNSLYDRGAYLGGPLNLAGLLAFGGKSRGNPTTTRGPGSLRGMAHSISGQYYVGHASALGDYDPTTEGRLIGGRVTRFLNSTKVDDQLAEIFSTMGATKVFGKGPNAATGAGLGGGLLHDLASNPKTIGSLFGKSAGSFAGGALGSAVLPIAGTVIGSLIGGALGSLFDKHIPRQVQALDHIERNTRSAATTLELERRFLEVSRGAVNVPARFVLPKYTPGASGGVVIQKIEIHAPDAEGVVVQLRAELGPMLNEAFRNIGVGR